MTTIAEEASRVTVGIDTHGEVRVAAVLDARGRLLGTESFPTTSAGHRRLERWTLGFGAVDAVGVEGTGAWGAGVARHLAAAAAGHRVVEVDRPDRSTRRRRGKSDTIDAEAAARAVQAGTARGTPKARNGRVESIRALRVVRRPAVKARSQAAHQLHCLVSTAPDELREALRGLRPAALVATAARLRPGDTVDPVQGSCTKTHQNWPLGGSGGISVRSANRNASGTPHPRAGSCAKPRPGHESGLRSIARRHEQLGGEIARLDVHLDRSWPRPLRTWWRSTASAPRLRARSS